MILIIIYIYLIIFIINKIKANKNFLKKQRKFDYFVYKKKFTDLFVQIYLFDNFNQLNQLNTYKIFFYVLCISNMI